MSIRLNQVVAKELNVGYKTAKEFLQKKGIEGISNPNQTISEEAYELLLKEFGKFGVGNAHAAKEPAVQKENNTPKPSVAKKETPEKLTSPHVIGTWEGDLSELKSSRHSRRKKKKSTTAAKPAEPQIRKDQPKPAPTAPQAATPPKNKQKQPEKPAPVAVEDVPKTIETTISQAPAETPQETPKKKTEPFRIGVKSLPGAKVLGTLDLTTIDTRTRPKPLSQKEKQKQRAEKKRAENERKAKIHQADQKRQAGQTNTKPTANNNANKYSNNNNNNADANKNSRPEHKKRERIKGERIDIEKGVIIPTLSKSVGGKPERQGNNNHNHNKPKDRGDNRPRKPFAAKNEISDEDVQKQIKETLERLTNTGKGLKKGAKYRKEKREAVSQRQSEQYEMDAQESKIIKITEFVTANDLANMMNKSVNDIIKTCMSIGIFVNINQRLDADTINIVAEEFGFKTEFVSAEVVEAITEDVDNPEDLMPRPPIVTVMGHVDHGKTSLLDNIRNTNVIAGEAGGITQHIGAYHVKLPSGRRITFLDTPGHEAFTAMRARGASVTDIAVIIVAADDNVMPQTIEAINHASAANVPIVFAINKIDRPGANPDKIKEALAAMNYLVEEWGGKYQSQDISAKQGIGVPELLEKILLEADLLELKANPTRKAIGSVIESSLDKGRGYVVTMLVQNGTLKMGDIILAGTHYGRVKAMFNERNQKITEAGPAEPVLILGLNGAPTAGDTIHVMETEQEARDIATKREQLQREQGLRTQKRITLSDISRRLAIGNFQELNIIVKGDVDGSVEALSDSLIRRSTEQIQVNVIHKGVGEISESDVILAAASDAIIVGFQVRPSQSARKAAEREGVDIRLYSIIYDAIEEVKAAMEGMLSPEIKEEITANVEIREVFKISKVGSVAGCMVRDGKIKRSNKVRLIRDGIVIYTGEIDSLKRGKDDAKEVTQGYECGLNIHNFNDIKVGDIIEAFEEVEVKQSL